MKICRETPSLLKIGQKYHILQEDLRKFYFFRSHKLIIKSILYNKKILHFWQLHIAQKNTHNTLLRFHCNSSYTNAPQYYVIIHCLSCYTLKVARDKYDTTRRYYVFFFSMAQQPLVGQGLLIVKASWSNIRHTTVGRSPLDEWSARRRDLYLTAHNTPKRQTSMPPAGFEPTITASKLLQTHALDRATTGIGEVLCIVKKTFSL
jgi:hypothetical protein